jgi:hypothetical protein
MRANGFGLFPVGLSLSKPFPSVRPEVSKDRAEPVEASRRIQLQRAYQVPVPLNRRGGRLTFLCLAKET